MPHVSLWPGPVQPAAVSALFDATSDLGRVDSAGYYPENTGAASRIADVIPMNLLFPTALKGH